MSDGLIACVMMLGASVQACGFLDRVNGLMRKIINKGRT
jgi:hypothetical protein